MSEPEAQQADTHGTFLEDLDVGFRAQLAVANYLAWNGWSVVIPGFRRSPTRGQAMHFRDQGDLFVKRPNGRWGRVEVRCIGNGGRGKGKAFTFTGRHDFPYGAVKVLVKRVFDNMKPRPWRVVSVSRDLAAAAVIDVARTFDRWGLLGIVDNATGVERNEYMCPVDLVEWVDLKI
jgi:hypothetical protein